MKFDGRMPWRATAICETLKIAFMIGKHRSKGRRFKDPFQGPIIPFGSLAENHSISPKDQSRNRQSGKQVLPGIFFGCGLHAGRIWEGDKLVVDLEELEEIDASGIHAKRLNAKDDQALKW